MALFTPGRRWQPPFFPFHKEKFGRRTLAKIERWIKGPMFGCRMCGNCLLQETAFICPMECPKGMRNGPCGGSSASRCYVDETRPCIWYRIYERAFRMGREEKLLEVLPPLDWDRVGTETWGSVVRQVRKFGTGAFFRSLFSKDKVKKSFAWESVFRPIRQPEWWQGDSQYHAPGYDEPISELERRLRSGNFIVTTEVSPPLGTSTGKLKRDIEMVRDLVAAVNFTDSASASPRMSSMACCKTATELGADPVLQIAARDKTRSGLQSEIVGANVIGVRNVLCITGDNACIGPSPTSNTNILDVDAVQMLWILRKMRDEGTYLDGRKMKEPPKLFLGAAASPFASEPKFQALREHKKVNAGAQFFQTNLIFDTRRLDLWLEALYARNILDKVYILAGVTPIRSYKMALYLNNKIPGVTVPEEILKKFENAKEETHEELGIGIALKIIDDIKTKQGINGIHLMSVGWESVVPRIVKESGLQHPIKPISL
jgi:methylenetetrahydrofolate reductase (NADPH)